jgi:hypothetical protein
MKIHRIDHVGLIVNDLPAAKVFFLDFSLEVQAQVSGTPLALPQGKCSGGRCQGRPCANKNDDDCSCNW